jgi:polysaccharide pyruvyl transferase CsaB
LNVRICQFAFIGSENLGDEAIFQTIYRDLQTLAPERISVLSMNPGRTKLLATASNTQVLSAKSITETLRAIRDCDVFVCGGGGIFQDQTSVYNPSRYLSRIEAAHFFGKLVFVYGVSVGPLTNPVNRALASRALGRAACITVRDGASREDLLALGVPAEVVHSTSDPVMNFSPDLPAPPAARSKRKVVVCLRHWFDTINWIPVSVVNKFGLRRQSDQERYEKFVHAMARVLDHVARNGDAELTFVPFWGERDTKVHHEVAAKMRTTSVKVLEQSPSPNDVNALIADADFVIGMRLHSLIYAVSNARPFFAIDYSKKVGDFLNEVLGESAASVSASPADLDADAVIARLDKLEQQSPFGDAYRSSVERLRQKERRNIELLKGELEKAGLSA